MRGGVLYGAVFDDQMIVRHIRAESIKGRDRMRGSKYVQSDMIGIYESVKVDLKNGHKVLFTGTPCQVDGLKRYLGNKTENLICVDLLCYGVGSPQVFKAHIGLIEKRTHAEVTDYMFRPKIDRYPITHEIACLDNGKKFENQMYSEVLRQVYYARLATRMSCHNCQYTDLMRVGDITIGDCSHINEMDKSFGGELGASVVLINSDKGEQIISAIQGNLHMMEAALDAVIQPPMREPSKPNSKRALFCDTFHRKGYRKAIDVCFGSMYALKYRIKKLMKKM